MAVGQASIISEEAFPKDKLPIPNIRTNYFHIEPLKLKLNYLIATLTIQTIRENKIIKSLKKQR